MKATSMWIAVAAITMCSTLEAGRPDASAAEAQPLEFRDSKAKEASMEQQIEAKEREGLDALKTGNLEVFGRLTAEEAVFVDAQGPASKAQVVKNVAGFTLTEYSMEGMRFIPLTSKSGLITYKIHEKGVSHGKEFSAQA